MMLLCNFCVLAGFVFALSACNSVENPKLIEFEAGTVVIHSYELTKKFLSGNTQAFYDNGHGTQIEYNAPDGKSFLWYPGNQRINVGRWRVQQEGSKPTEICYLYGANSYNRVTKKWGGNWKCKEAIDHTVFVSETVRGDPFGLGKRTRVLFTIVGKSKFPLKSLAVWLGKNPETLYFIKYVDDL